MKDAASDRLLGRTIAGKYRIEVKIGQGGMGRVYRARHVVTGKVVALKVLLEDLAAYPSFVERFLHEARAAAYLTHPHAINIIDCGRDGEIVYLLMEYLEGETLTDVLRREGPLSPERAARILRQICAALAEAHARGIIHRDLKPDNIILQQVAGEKDYVKVLDFGIAKVLDEQKRGEGPISRSVFVGTPEYASPEQCNAQSPTALSDIYSLGVILYEMLTGRPPFEGDPLQVMFKHVHEDPPSLRTWRPELGPEIDAVVRRALSKDPATRPQSVWELAEAFERAVRAEPLLERTRPGREKVRSRSIPTQPDLLKPSRAGIGHGRWGRLGILGVSAAAILGIGSLSYQTYRWFKTWPPMPAPPAIAPAPAPRAVYDPIAEAWHLFETGDREGAARLLREMIAASASAPARAHLLLGVIYLEQGEIAGAKSELALALERAGGSLPEAYLHLGRALVEEGDLEGAERAFRTALEQSRGRLLGAAAALGELYQRQGRGEEAERVMRAALHHAGETAEDLLDVGRILLLQKQYELALREVRRAIRLKNGFFPQAHLLLGRILLERGDLDLAIEVLSTALAQRGGADPTAHHLLGRAFLRRRDPERAVAELRAALRLRGGNDPEVLADLAQALADPILGRYEEAESALRAALAIRRRASPDALEALAQMYLLRMGRLEDARKIWQSLPTDAARQWLERTRDALALQARSDASSRTVRASAPSRLTFELALTPHSGEQEMVALWLLEDVGVGLRWEPPGSLRPVRVLGMREHLLDPLDGTFDLRGPMEITLIADSSDLILLLDGRELARVKQKNTTAPLVFSVRGGRAVLFHFREA